jgi:hypothetical protein
VTPVQQKLSAMSDEFNIRLATIADSQLIAWHRARMFQDMGYVPVELFDYFRAKSEARLGESLASGEYVGWLASQRSSPQTIIAAAGVQLRNVLPHPDWRNRRRNHDLRRSPRHHSSRALYERLGFVLTKEMRFSGNLGVPGS